MTRYNILYGIIWHYLLFNIPKNIIDFTLNYISIKI